MHTGSGRGCGKDSTKYAFECDTGKAWEYNESVIYLAYGHENKEDVFHSSLTKGLPLRIPFLVYCARLYWDWAMKSTKRKLSPLYSPVQSDWRAWLPEAKARVFQDLERNFENAYAMFSVALDEAITLRQKGQLGKARQAAAVSGALSGMLSNPLAAMLRALDAHARHYGTLPHTDPLNPDNFRGMRCQRTARMSKLLSLVLLTERSQFLHKIHTLLEMTEEAERHYAEAASEVSEGTATAPMEAWLVLEELHYDLNTCFRESVVVLKSFLRALPEEELADFERQARRQPAPTAYSVASAGKIQHRPSLPFARK